MLLHEFAVDPEALINPDRCAYVLDQMGVRHGRMISEFPKFGDWLTLIRRACDKAGVAGVARTRIIAKVRSAKIKIIKSDESRLYRKGLDWLENAERQDALSRFHAIVAARNPNASNRVLVAGDFGEQTPLWNVHRERSVPRTADALARCVAPVFRNCREILLVDYRFDPRQPRWREALGEFARVATQNGRRFARCEYHFSLASEREENRFDLRNEDMRERCREDLVAVLPEAGFPLELYQWKRIASGGHRLHPRYILTEIGGVRIENGLDVGKPGEETDVSLLDTNLWEQRWSEFQTQSTPFTLSHPPLKMH